MFKLKREIKQKMNTGLGKIDPIIRTWIFGTVMIIISIFADPRIIPAILVFLILLTISYRKSNEGKLEGALIEVEELMVGLREEEGLVKGVKEEENYTLEERIFLKEIEDEKKTLEEYKIEILEKIEKMEIQNKNFKNFLVKWKNTSKMLVTGKWKTNKKKRND